MHSSILFVVFYSGRIGFISTHVNFAEAYRLIFKLELVTLELSRKLPIFQETKIRIKKIVRIIANYNLLPPSCQIANILS